MDVSHGPAANAFPVLLPVPFLDRPGPGPVVSASGAAGPTGSAGAFPAGAGLPRRTAGRRFRTATVICAIIE